MNGFDRTAAAAAIGKCGNLGRRALADRILSAPAAPDLLVFTHRTQGAAWRVQRRGGALVAAEGSGLTPAGLADLLSFWDAAGALLGHEMPWFGPAVEEAATVLAGETPAIVPCAAAYPAEVFEPALRRAALLLKRDLPLLGGSEFDTPFAAFWRLSDDRLFAVITPLDERS